MRPIFWIIALGLLVSSVSVKATTLNLVTLESPPAEFSRNGKATGRNVEIAVECLRQMGFKSEVIIIPWKRALVMVKIGSADAIIDAAYNTERAEFLYYPDDEIYVEEWYAFKRKGEALTFNKDLSNVKQYSLGITRGFEYGGLIQKAINNKLFKNMEEAVDNEMNIRKLVANRFDVFVGVKLTILNLANKIGRADQLEMVNMTETGEPYLLSSSKTYLAFSKVTMTEDMAKNFSITLKKLKEDGIVSAIEKKYY